ncbi:MAG: serine hydrolase [Inhella sp.]
MTVSGVERLFPGHLAAGLSSPKAGVLVLHGGGGEGLGVSELGKHPLSVFRTVADREGFVVVYPGGLPAKDIESNPGWDDCRADNTVASGADDVGFLSALITRVSGEFKLPLSKVFMAGGSNGAQMTQAFAFNRPEMVAAVASAGGALPEKPKPGACTTGPGRPVAIALLHGTGDTQMPWAGGCVANLGGACNRGRVVSAEATRDRWLQINGLSAVVPTTTVVNLDPTDAGPATRFDHAGNPPLQWWRLDGAGHTVPSRTVLTNPNPATGIQNRDVEFAEVAWAFFQSRLSVAPSAQALKAAKDYSFATGGQTFMVMHQGVVLDEAYAAGGGESRTQLLASATKGLTGLVGAIGASQGLYDLDEPVAQRALTEWKSDPTKSKITYRHLLTMTSGLKELNDLKGWQEYLAAPVLNPPGEVFIYSGDPNIFGLALERLLAGESAVSYFDRVLLKPLGITSLRWGSNFEDGHPNLSGGAYLTARDWSKLGEFIRLSMDGAWTGPSLLKREVFEQVFKGQKAHPAYGFYWWLKRPVPADLGATIDANNKSQFTRQIKPIIDDARVPADFVMAAGAYDQRLYIIPSRGLTVIRNGPTGNDSFDDIEFLGRLLQ